MTETKKQSSVWKQIRDLFRPPRVKIVRTTK